MDRIIDFLKNEELFQNIPTDVWDKLQQVFVKYAGTHPYLLNSARDILADIQQAKEEISAQRLEGEILQKLQQGKDSKECCIQDHGFLHRNPEQTH